MVFFCDIHEKLKIEQYPLPPSFHRKTGFKTVNSSEMMTWIELNRIKGGMLQNMQMRPGNQQYG